MLRKALVAIWAGTVIMLVMLVAGAGWGQAPGKSTIVLQTTKSSDGTSIACARRNPDGRKGRKRESVQRGARDRRAHKHLARCR